MHSGSLGAGLGIMDEDERSRLDRGSAIKGRRERLGIRSVRAFAAWMAENAERLGMQHPVSIDALTAAEKGKASPQTYDRLEAFLGQLEHEVGIDQATLSPDGVEELAGQMIEVNLTGNFGVSATVKGPREATDELKSLLAVLVQQMREEPKDGA